MSKTSDPGYAEPSPHPASTSPRRRHADEPIGGMERMAIEWNRPQPNRFDPYEALEFILRTLTVCGEKKDHEPRDGSVNLPWGDADTIRQQVYALRAYITGMEK